jgi:hypothetical protein
MVLAGVIMGLAESGSGRQHPDTITVPGPHDDRFQFSGARASEGGAKNQGA